MAIHNRKLQDYESFIKQNDQFFINSERGIEVLTDINEINTSINCFKNKFSIEDTPNNWNNIGVVYEDEYLWFLCDVIKFQDDRLNLHHRIIRKGGEITGVAILGKYKNKVVLLRHFRHPSRRTFLEIPRGGVIEGKTTDESIVQEIEEEIGGSISKLEKLQIIHPSTSIDTASIQCYFGEYETIKEPSIAEGILEIICMTPDEVIEAIRNGKITDSVTICAYYQSVLHGFI